MVKPCKIRFMTFNNSYFNFFLLIVVAIMLPNHISTSMLDKAEMPAYKWETLDKEKMNKVTQKDVDCLAKNIYFEAANQSYEGKYAVARVTLNRAMDSRYPNSICKVVYQKNQFSWTAQKRLAVKYPDAWQESVQAAHAILKNPFHFGNMYGVTHYHATYVKPYWSGILENVGKIGDHVFYRNRQNQVDKTYHARI